MSDNDAVKGLCLRAAAHVAKYCEKDAYGQPLLIDIDIWSTSVHPGNRGFFYTQGKACKSLLLRLGKGGFLKDEANTKPIMMRERPSHDRPPEYESFLAYNLRKSKRDDLLAGTYLPSDPIVFANLAHCHLLNMSRAAGRGLPWGEVFPSDTGIRSTDGSGNLSISAIAANKNLKELKEFIAEGFKGCKVLSHKMDDEEPSAASAISAAANKGQAVALQEHEWTALNTLNGMCIPSNGELSEQALYASFLERATDVLGVETVQHHLFKYVIQFVHQLRGQQQSYISELVEFGENMVDSSVRRASFNLYKTACAMNPNAPNCQIAMIKKQYSQKADEGKNVPNPSGGWLSVKPDWLQQLEVMLRYLKLKEVRSALAAKIPENTSEEVKSRKLNAYSAELNLWVVRAFEETAFTKSHKCTSSVVRDVLVEAAREVFVKYDAVSKLPTPPHGQEWLKFDGTAQAAKTKAKAKGRPKKEEVKLPPLPSQLKGKLQKISSFDEAAVDVTVEPVEKDGNNTQGATEFLSIPWEDWHRSEVYVEQGLHKSLEDTVRVALREIQVGVDTTTLPIDIKATRDGRQRKVVATTDIPKGTLMIPPCASKSVRLVTTSPHPHAIAVTVHYNNQRRSMMPNYNNAQSTPTAPAALSDDGTQSGNAAHTSTPAGVDAANSAQSTQDNQTGDTAAANVTGGGGSGGSSTDGVEYKKEDVLTEKFGGREWKVANVHDDSSLTLIAPAEDKAKQNERSNKVHDTVRVAISDIPATYERKPSTAPAGEAPSQAPRAIGTRHADNTADGSTTAAGSAPQASVATQSNDSAQAATPYLTQTFFLLPEFTAPEWVDAQQQPEVNGWRWMHEPDVSMHPFWAVRRLSPSALALQNVSAVKKGTVAPQFNLEFKEFIVNVTVGGTCDTTAFTDIRRCTVLALTNSENIIKGSELLLQVAEPKREHRGLQLGPANKRQKCNTSAQAASGKRGWYQQPTP